MLGLWTAQVAHVAAGVVFAGGQVVWWAAVWPGVLTLPAADARRVLRAVGPRVGAVLGGAALASIGSGVYRGWAYGTANVGWLAVALVLTGAAMIHGRRSGPRLADALFDGDQWRPDARRQVLRAAAIALGCVAGVVGSMAALRLGL